MEMLLGGILILLGIIGIRFDIQSNKMIKLMEEYLQLEKDYADSLKEANDEDWDDMMRLQANDIHFIKQILKNNIKL